MSDEERDDLTAAVESIDTTLGCLTFLVVCLLVECSILLVSYFAR